MFARIGVALLLFGALGLGVLVFHRSQQAPTPANFHGTWLEQARSLHPFTLEDINQQPFTSMQLKGQWTWLFFGFTSCPQLCPMTLTKLAKAYQALKQQGVKPLPNVVMVTLDPAQDTLSQLQHYVQAFDSSFSGARGSESAVKALTKELGVAYMKTRLPGSTISTIEHSGVVMVVNPEGKLQAFFTPPFTVAQLVSDHQLLVD